MFFKYHIVVRYYVGHFLEPIQMFASRSSNLLKSVTVRERMAREIFLA